MTPFVVVGMPRTGSTLLLLGLGQHPDVQVYGELFHPMKDARESAHRIPTADGFIAFDEAKDDGLAFLKEHVFTPRHKGAVGFKLFGKHVQCKGAVRLLRRMREEIPGLRVIHIIRPNLLEVLVSERRAVATGKWSLPVGGGNGPDMYIPPIKINPQVARAYFDDQESNNAYLRMCFAHGPYITVDYDDLSRYFADEVQKVYDFLGVKRYIAKPSLQKQIIVATRSCVSNYDELADAFRGSKYESMFTQTY